MSGCRLSTAFRSAVRLACLLPGNRFGGYRFNAFRRAAAYLSETGPCARNGLSLARNGSRFRGLHSGVNGPGLLLRCLAYRFPCSFGLSAPQPELVCPNSRRFHASDPSQSYRQTHPAALPISTPLQEFWLLRDQSVQWASLPSGPPSESARFPLAPRSPSIARLRLRIIVRDSLRFRRLAAVLNVPEARTCSMRRS
jgi:hypothetical protein